jgi:hypothetical protein
MQSIVLAGEWYAPRHDLDGAEERGEWEERKWKKGIKVGIPKHLK